MQWSRSSRGSHAVDNRISVAVIVLLIVALAATSYLAYSNYKTGQRWLDRAHLAEGDVERLDQENAQLEEDLVDVKRTLKKSENDVARLEDRVSQVANEKAEVEDEREVVTAYLERTAEIAVAYDEVASQFQRCRSETAEFTSMLSNADYYYDTGQWYLLSQQAVAADAACGAAEQLLSELRSYVDALS